MAAACHGDPAGERAWPRVIAEHVQKITRGVNAGDPFRGLSAAEVMSRTYARILPVEALPDWNGLSYARDMAPGLKEALSLDLPETVATFLDDHLKRYGGLDDLRRVGHANLRALPVEEVKRLDAPDGGHFDVLLGRSLYTASRGLVMADLLAQLLGPVNTSHGVLTCIASRHQIAVHVIGDATVIPSLNHMARFAAAGYSDGVGSLSPHVYWWHNDVWEQLTAIDNDGNTAIHVGADFGRLLEEAIDPPGA